MTLETCRRSCRVQGRVFKPTSSILFRLPLLFKSPDKLAGTQALLSGHFNITATPLGLPNVLTVTLIGSGALSRVYSNEEIQEIIWTIIEARLVAIEKPCKHLFKAYFFDIYRMITIWLAITSVSNTKIILLPLEQKDLIAYIL